MNQSFTSFLEFRKRYPIRPNDEGMLLGSGSYGKVIKVEDQVETEWVAIKISEFKGHDPKSLKAEVELAQRVPRQANIARYDACYRLETDTSVSDFAIMKYYQDGNLADLLKNKKLAADDIQDITRGILLGLQHLHRHRIVHRDFKPANILISRDNRGRFVPKIADFGLSKLVSDDEIDSSDFDLSDGRGTPSYKAPEQIDGSRVSFNLDLWAFGVILYEMLTGEKPFASDSRAGSEQLIKREIEKKIVTVTLPKRVEQLPEPYQQIIKRCLVKDIRKRVRKADELLALLDETSVATLIRQADLAFQNKQYSEAQSIYEQVLKRDPANTAASKGLALCIDARRPRPVAIVLDEATDLRQQEEAGTDIFDNAQLHAPGVAVNRPSASTKPLVRANMLWGAIPVLAVLIGAGIYVNSPVSPSPNSDSTQVTIPQDVTEKNPTKTAGIGKGLVSPKSVDKSLPTSGKTSQQITTVVPENQPKPEPLSDATAEAQRVAETLALKQKAQLEYDNLITEGAAAITNGNNKALAITTFLKARDLASTEALSTDKASEKYASYFKKANKIFETEEFEGAKAWFLVAQALSNTAEVKAKIRECEKNL